jgi:hypothetical protein
MNGYFTKIGNKKDVYPENRGVCLKNSPENSFICIFIA